MISRTRVVLADDDILLREGLAGLLGRSGIRMFGRTPRPSGSRVPFGRRIARPVRRCRISSCRRFPRACTNSERQTVSLEDPSLSPRTTAEQSTVEPVIEQPPQSPETSDGVNDDGS